MAQKTECRLSTGRGSWDEGREKWEGEIPAEPKTVAIGDWRLATAASEVVKPKIFRQCRNSALQKNRSPLATHHSLLAVHYSPLTIRHSLLAIRCRFPCCPLLLLPRFSLPCFLLRRHDVSKGLKAHNRFINHFRHFNGTVQFALLLPSLWRCSLSAKNDPMRLQFSGRFEGHGQIARFRHRFGDIQAPKNETMRLQSSWAT
jgi:hypothetical protein